MRRLEEGRAQPAVIQRAVEWRIAEVRPGREVDPRHPILRARVGVRRVQCERLAESLSQLRREREAVVPAPIGHPVDLVLAERRVAPGRSRYQGRADRPVEHATALPASRAGRAAEVRLADVDLPDGVRVEEVDRRHLARRETPVNAQRQFQVLRQLEAGVEEADSRTGATSGRAGPGLVDRIKPRHVGPITEHDGFVAGLPVAVPQPAVGRRAAEQSDTSA